MDAQQERLAELDCQLRQLKRIRALHYLWLVALFAVGTGLGFAVAEVIIDPITVITDCSGIEV